MEDTKLECSLFDTRERPTNPRQLHLVGVQEHNYLRTDTHVAPTRKSPSNNCRAKSVQHQTKCIHRLPTFKGAQHCCPVPHAAFKMASCAVTRIQRTQRKRLMETIQVGSSNDEGRYPLWPVVFFVCFQWFSVSINWVNPCK